LLVDEQNQREKVVKVRLAPLKHLLLLKLSASTRFKDPKAAI
jgi:hypothetical protein